MSITGENLSLGELLSMGPMAEVTNPYVIYKKLRDDSRIYDMSEYASTMASNNEGGAYFISRYDDVREILKNEHGYYSNDINQRTMGIVMGPTVIGMDGKDHLKHRTLVTPSMRPKLLRGEGSDFPSVVRGVADKYLDKMIAKYQKDGKADMHNDFTFHYPLAVFVTLLGLKTDQDLEQVHRWGQDLCLVASEIEKGLIASEELLNFLSPIVEDKRNNLGDDMISKLITSEVNGEHLSTFEIVSFLRLLVLAGAETTNHAIGSAWVALVNDPELQDRVRADRSLVPKLLEEVLRWESPVGTVMRETIEEVTIGGVTIPKNAGLLLNLGAANRDERKFANPDVFDINRENNSDHIAFGYGNHFCVGSHLARLEAEIGINAVLDRVKNVRYVGDDEKASVEGFSFRGPARLPVTFDVA